jgi:hypothetical protein
MTDDWTIYVILGCAFYIVWRIDRLGRQLEAVCANIKAELSSPDRADEILREWKEEKNQQAKDQRVQLIFAGVIVAVAIAWGIASRH